MVPEWEKILSLHICYIYNKICATKLWVPGQVTRGPVMTSECENGQR